METLYEKAESLFKHLDAEYESMPKSINRRMFLDQQTDPEWQRIENNILSESEFEEDRIKWVILIERLQLCWIRRWLAKHSKFVMWSEMKENE